MGVFLSWTRTNAIIHLSSIILTSLSWKFNPMRDGKDKCPLTLMVNNMAKVKSDTIYKDLFWLFNIKTFNKIYYGYFIIISLLDLWVIFK